MSWALMFLATLGTLACTARSPVEESARLPCAPVSGSAAARICAQDRLPRNLSIRFRVDVSAASERMTLDGILLVRDPGAVRLKMFGFGGLTVYDSLWVGDRQGVRGWVQRPFASTNREVVFKPGEPIEEAEVLFGRALWSLWQPRCSGSPRGRPRGPILVDPESARVVERKVRLGMSGIEEEWMQLSGLPDSADEVHIRYEDLRCVHSYLLPHEVEIEVQSLDWRAKVRVLEQNVDADFDDRIFLLPDAAEASR